MTKVVNVCGVKFGGNNPLALIAGPCVIESRELCMDMAKRLVAMSKKMNVPLIFKASYDKANRTSINSYRGPGIAKGLEILAEIKAKYNVPILTDIHSEQDIQLAAQVVDILQIPAFLCRQTDIVVAAGESGKAVYVKKGQFLAPWDMKNIIKKIESTGNRAIVLTERGSSFGYGNLVVDMCGLEIMKETGYPVILDATHAVQKPGALGDKTGGNAAYAPLLARAAAAVGVAGIFFEAHPNPALALSDGPNSLALKDVAKLVNIVSEIDSIAKRIK